MGFKYVVVNHVERRGFLFSPRYYSCDLGKIYQLVLQGIVYFIYIIQSDIYNNSLALLFNPFSVSAVIK